MVKREGMNFIMELEEIPEITTLNDVKNVMEQLIREAREVNGVALIEAETLRRTLGTLVAVHSDGLIYVPHEGRWFHVNQVAEKMV